MIVRVLRRLLAGLGVTWVAFTVVFALVFVVGDPAVATLGEKAGPEQIASFRAARGLDRPLPEQYGRALAALATGDLGRSFRDDQPVATLIATRLPRTLLLGGLALAFELALGVALGVVAAMRRDRPADALAMSAAYLGVSTPTFLSGLVLLYWLAFRFGLFPVGGYGVTALEHLEHAILPAMTLALFGAATYARLLRGELIDAYGRDYVRCARARGLSETRVLFGHALRTALLPIVALLGLQVGALVSGAIVTEKVFGWPGMGRLAYESVAALDLPVILGVVVVASVAVQLGNALADLALGWLDPRTRA